MCLNCNAVLYDGDEVVIDNCGIYFCSYDCAYERFRIREIEELEETDPEFCEDCCDRLNPDYVIYKDCDGDYYCSKECVDNLYGLENTILEYVED